MLDTVRKLVRERFGRLAPKGTEDLPRTLVEQGRATKEQATRVARDVVEWSRKNTEVVADLVRREVRQQIARLGVATKEEVIALRKRLSNLEGGTATRASRKTGAKKTAAKRPTKKTGAKRTGAKKGAARKTAAKKTSAKRPAVRKTSRRARRA